MIRALWVSGGVVLVALIAMFQAPPGQADPLGTLFRTVLSAGVLIFLGRLAGTAEHGRPPRALAVRVVVLIFVAVIIEVLALGFSPNWSIALAVWYLTLFGVGVLMNRWCDAPERYTILVAAFIVVASSLILMVIAAVSPAAQTDTMSKAVLVSLWPNVARIAGHPAEAAWTWLAWRLADRLRPKEAKRKKLVPRAPVTPAPRRPV